MRVRRWDQKRRGVAEAIVACAALWVCAATSSPGGPPPPDGDPDPTEQFPEPTAQSATIIVHNALAADAVVRVRRLADAADLDCEAIDTDPGALLSEALLGAAESWTIPKGDNLGIDVFGQRGCHALWVEADGLAPRWLYWRQGQLPRVDFFADERPEGEGVVVVGGDELGVSFTGAPTVVFEPRDLPRATETCAPTTDGHRLTWSTPVPSGGTLASASYGADGCWAIAFGDGDDTTSPWYVCMSEEAWPFAEGAVLEVETRYSTGSEGVVVTEAGHTSGEGPSVVLSRGSDAPSMPDLSFEYIEDDGCGFDVMLQCGTVTRVGSMRVSTDEGDTAPLARGEAVDGLATGEGQTVRVEAYTLQERVALHAECGAGPDVLGTDIELTITTL